jgi:acyl carrier protein
MTSTETTSKAEGVIVATINELLQRRGANGVTVKPESNLLTDLNMDSLEVAELAAALDDEVGHEPFSEGIVPETVGELVGFYNKPQ